MNLALEFFEFLDSLPHGYCIFNKSFEIVHWNRTIARWSHQKADEMLGKNLVEKFPKLKEARYLKRLELALELGVPTVFSPKIHGQLIDCPLSGGGLQVHNTYLTRFDDHGVLLMEDVSKSARSLERYRELTELHKESEQKALAATQAKSEFLARMSHEIRTPLNAIIGMTSLMEGEDLSVHPQFSEYLSMIKLAGDSLLNIVNEVLDLSKIERGKVEIEESEFDFKQMAFELAELFSKAAKAKKLSFKSTIDNNLPDRLVGDPGKIRQIITNLIGNAIKFTSEGGVELHVELLSRKGQHYRVQTRVKDTGIGISEEQKQTIFQAFVQADTSTTRIYGGTGLGLAISQNFAHLMGGVIDIKSHSLGAEFIFEVGLKNTEQQASPANNNKEPRANELPFFERFKILVAEDNKVNQNIISQMLQSMNISFDLVENGDQAIDVLKKNQYDLVLMDCHMPVLDGYDASRIIKADDKLKEIPVIAFTANALSEDKAKCAMAGMDDTLHKPIRKQEVADKLFYWFKKIDKIKSSAA